MQYRCRSGEHIIPTSICDRLENLTECFAEIKVLDDATGLYNRENFLKMMDAEIQRASRYRTNLSLCLMRFEFDNRGMDVDHSEKEAFLRTLSDGFLKEIGSCDTLSRFDERTFALLIPHSSVDEATDMCDRLRHRFEEINNSTERILATLNVGLTDFMPGTDASGDDMLARATAILQSGKNTT